MILKTISEDRQQVFWGENTQLSFEQYKRLKETWKTYQIAIRVSLKIRGRGILGLFQKLMSISYVLRES